MQSMLYAAPIDGIYLRTPMNGLHQTPSSDMLTGIAYIVDSTSRLLVACGTCGWKAKHN